MHYRGAEGHGRLAARMRDRDRRDAIHRRVLVRGLEVYLVNARDTKNVPGRKSGVQESPWLKLHTYGLLRNSFRPSQQIRIMRTYWRQRNDLLQSAGRHILRIEKALRQMNLHLAKGEARTPEESSTSSGSTKADSCGKNRSRRHVFGRCKTEY